MPSDTLVTWLFVYALIGSIIWAALVAVGLLDRAYKEQSLPAVVFASVGVVFAWPLIVFVFIGGMIEGQRRRARKVRG